MAGAALLSVTLVPALMVLFVRGRILPEGKNPTEPAADLALPPGHPPGAARPRSLTILLAVVALAATWIPAMRLGSEFMPNLNEGTLFYMPTTLPGLSVTKAAELLQTQNKIIKSFPEVESRLRQGRPRGDRHRSGAARDVRDRHQPEAGRPNGRPA